jgi:hypothetical protein
LHSRKRPVAAARGIAGDEPRPPSRSELRAAAARAKLTPLAPGERPVAVTAATALAVALALANVAAYAAGAKVGGHRPAAVQIVAFSGVALALAAGMWRNRYWAVLTMQALLGIAIVVFAILLMVARNLLAAFECVAVIAIAGTLFWFLVRAMGRIQATERSSLGIREPNADTNGRPQADRPPDRSASGRP